MDEMMRQIIEDALITFRQEAANLLIISAPAMLLGPILIIIADSGLTAALITLPLFLLLYLATYAACVRAAGFIVSNLAPDAGMAYLYVLSGWRDILRVGASGVLLLALILGGALVIGTYVSGLLGLALSALAIVAFLVWAAQHAFDQPLVLVYGASAEEVLHGESSRISRDYLLWALILLAAISSPLFVAALVSWGLALAIAPSFGGAVFAMAVGAWLPLPALCLTTACSRAVEAPA